jgi:hypothetical protein
MSRHTHGNHGYRAYMVAYANNHLTLLSEWRTIQRRYSLSKGRVSGEKSLLYPALVVYPQLPVL